MLPRLFFVIILLHQTLMASADELVFRSAKAIRDGNLCDQKQGPSKV